MDQENEHHVAATDTEAATGQDEGTGKKRRRRRRGKRRAEAVATDGTAAPADTDSLDDASDDSSDDDSDDRDEQRTEAAPDGAATGEQRKKKRRRKKKRSGDQPTEQSGETPAPLPSDSTAPPVVPAADAPARPARPERPKRAERQERAQQQQDRQPPKDRPAKEIPSRGSVLQRRMSRMNNVDDEQRSDELIAILPPPTVVTVDAYVSHLRGWQREVVTTIRSIIRNAAPDIEEDILWSQPVYSLNGPMCYVKAFSDHVNFGFWRGVELDDPDHLLVGELMKMRHIRIGHVNEVRRDRFEAWVRQAVRLNKEKGDPTSF